MFAQLRSTISPAAALLASLAIFSTSAVAQEKSIDVMSGPFGTGTYVLSNALEQISKESGSAVVLNASETPGVSYNARFLAGDDEARSRTVLAFSTGTDYLATEGVAPFAEKIQPSMLIANYILASAWLASLDETIETPEDLVGKRIGLGRPPQILWTIEPDLIIEHGWQIKDEVRIENLGTNEAAQALLNGSVDAAVIGGYANLETGTFLPSPQTVELLSSGRSLHHIPWGEEAIAATIEFGIPLIPTELPAGAIDGLEQALPTFFDTAFWAVYPEFDEETAYEITRMIIENVEKFADFHALGSLMTKSSLAYGWSEERIHPGALRAYREAGLID